MTWHHCWNVIGFMLNCTLQGLSVNFSNQSYGSHIIQLLHSLYNKWVTELLLLILKLFFLYQMSDEIKLISLRVWFYDWKLWYPELCVVSRTLCGIKNSVWYQELCVVSIIPSGIQNYI